MKKNVRRVLAALLGVMMILTLSMTAITAEEAAEENPKVSIPVTIRLTGDYPRNERYTIVLKADDAAYPMPEGSVNGRYEMTVTGAGSASFPEIVYDRVGVYTYQVWQKPGSDPDGHYDDTVYHVTVYITNDETNGGLNITVVAYADGNTEEKTDIVFENYYEYDFVPPPPETKPETEPETKPERPEPPETKPVETEPPETKPVETEPEETEPEETEPEETEPETEPETETETEPEETEEILEQTGQLNWPISVLSVGGMGCLALGCVFLTGDRKKENEDESEDLSDEEVEKEFEEGLEEANDKEETDGE